MKRLSSILIATAALSLAACQQELTPEKNIDTPSFKGEPVLKATLDRYGTDTKAVIDTSYEVWWQDTDTILVDGRLMICTPNPDSLRLADFSWKDPEETHELTGGSFGYYPASIVKGGKLILPDVIPYAFDNGTKRPVISFSPMAGRVFNKTIGFDNCCGLLEFSATGSAKVTKIYVSDSESGTSGALVPAKALCGEFTIKSLSAVLTAEALATGKGIILDCGNGVQLSSTPTKFYLPVPVGSYGDLRMAYYDDNQQLCIQDAGAVEIERNVVYIAPTQNPTFKVQKKYFCIKATAPATKGGSQTIIKLNSSNGPAVDIKYSTDGAVTWKTLVAGKSEITLQNEGDSVLFRAGPEGNAALSESEDSFNSFSISGGQVAVSGDIMFLLNQKGALSGSDTLKAKGFYGLFNSSNISDAGNLTLPETGLRNACFSGMFLGCKDLAEAPALNATELAPGCYEKMFSGCSSLVDAPELPATELKPYCYSGMFQGCSSLENAPELPAESLVTGCYKDMFNGCSQLGSVACYGIEGINADNAGNMLSGTASGLVFAIVPGTQPQWDNAGLGADNPVYDESSLNTLAIKAGANGAKVKFTIGSASFEYTRNIKIVKDITNGNVVSIPAGATLWVKAKNPNSSLNGCNFKVTEGSASLSGNVMGLLNAATSPTTAPANAFTALFSGNDKISDISSLQLTATTLGKECYKEMFKGCTSITSAPVLPATNLSEGCYQSMFQGCSQLDSVTCYAGDAMIKNCVKDMVKDCAAGGTLVRSNLSEWAIALPSGWTVKDTLGNTSTCYGIYDGVSYYGCRIGDTEWAPVNCGFDPTTDDFRTSSLKTYYGVTFDVQKAPYGLVYQWGRKTAAIYYYEYDASFNKSELAQTYNTYYSTSTGDAPNYAIGAGHTIPFIRSCLGKSKAQSAWCTDYYNYSKWTSDYDPCPDGWHIPTDAEFQELYNQGYSEIVATNRAERHTVEGVGSPVKYSMASYKIVGRYFGKSNERAGVFLGGYGFYSHSYSKSKYAIASSPMDLNYKNVGTRWRYWSSEKGQTESWGHSLMLFSSNNEYKPWLNDDREQNIASFPMSAANPIRCVRTAK